MPARLDGGDGELRFEPSEPLNGYAEVVDYLRREMALGRLRAGDRLPSERKLSEMLGVARETLRQALRVLEGSGQLEVHRGSRGGATVREAHFDRQGTLDSLAAGRGRVMGLIEFRTVVECAAAEFAAARRTADDLAAMRRAQDALTTASELSECRHSDTEFHLALASACGNEQIYRAVEEARFEMFDIVDVLGYQFIRESCLEAHERILDAVSDGDAARAGDEMRAHLAVTRTEYDQVIREQRATSA